MRLDIVNKSGESTGRFVDFDDEIFGEKPNEHTVYLAVKAYLANQRQGTHKAKERSEISGSTRKLHKQKGTGGSRKGSIKNALFHGGPRVFGPRPRNYSQDLNKKVKKVAKRSAIVDKIMNNKLIIVEDFSFEAPKTKDLIEILGNLKVARKPLIITADIDKNVYLSGRNIPKANITYTDQLNVYEIINSDSVVLFEGAVSKLVNSLS